MPGQVKMCLSPFIQYERKYILSKARENVHYSKTPSHRKMNRCHWLYFLQEGQYLGVRKSLQIKTEIKMQNSEFGIQNSEFGIMNSYGNETFGHRRYKNISMYARRYDYKYVTPLRFSSPEPKAHRMAMVQRPSVVVHNFKDLLL